MDIDNAIVLLADVIADSERKNRSQGIEFYKSAIRMLQNKNLSDSELKDLQRNFCGYLAHGDFSNAEYQKILKLIELLE
ncbi:hypothetical protein ABRQ07_20320 [Pectobacterium polonicum]|uniref:Uncharacterized protein n=1 Tax=Pectobacterium polonicum TaxID=2485124 RepID=A0ABV1PFI1_9GAMM|nr:hypothetical protein [Pectobacterium polonicum]MDC9821177.1 hypothetical protein [Pectobacterium polonicum]